MEQSPGDKGNKEGGDTQKPPLPFLLPSLLLQPTVRDPGTPRAGGRSGAQTAFWWGRRVRLGTLKLSRGNGRGDG